MKVKRSEARKKEDVETWPKLQVSPNFFEGEKLRFFPKIAAKLAALGELRRSFLFF